MGSGDERYDVMIQRAREVLPADDRVLAVYLIGSYATGAEDRFSDLDVHLVVTDASIGWFEEHWDDVLRDLAGPTVFTERLGTLAGGLGITPDWLHLDLIAHPLASFDRFQYDGVRVLFDRDGTLFPDGDQRAEHGRPGTAYWPDGVVQMFLYFLGNLVTVLGRDERVVANQGVGVVRDQLIRLMLAERGVRRTGGAKRLNALLSAEQRAVLEGVPAAGSDPTDVIAANQYLCREMLRRGKALALETGAPWPAEFVDATLAHLQRHFGIAFD
ncbi:aminoglycoside 6-adenylyltransferase [Kribbella sp. NPDC051587]|uniref:aminoglycoside 6-adenylyltransferase n=1 Tax=Kribbella sp. NPDC051587 TaxID=3364119 RepID=UPI0037A9C36A